MLIEDFEKEIYNNIKEKSNIQNVVAIYYFFRLFNLSSVSKKSFQFIERCFPILVDSTPFLELEFKSISKILSSSELNIDSELEVFEAVVSWLGHKKERSKYAKHLFLKTRLSLLSIPALRFISDKISNFIDDCTFINEVILEKSKNSHTKNFKPVSRYCNQDKFDIIVCVGKQQNSNCFNGAVQNVYSFEANNFKDVTTLPKLEEGKRWSKVVCIKDSIFALSVNSGSLESVSSVEKYTVFSNSWETVAHMLDKRIQYSVCSFMENIYVFGGLLHKRFLNCCSKFTPTDCSFRNIAKMTTARNLPSSAVFEGKIVVSGGNNNGLYLNSVEAYDHIADAWTNMPDMIDGRWNHVTVAMKNKLFVVGGYKATFEVYDSFSGKFILIKPPSNRFIGNLCTQLIATSIGSKLVFFSCFRSKCFLYDVENEVWSDNPCKVIKKKARFSCAKMPRLKKM